MGLQQLLVKVSTKSHVCYSIQMWSMWSNFQQRRRFGKSSKERAHQTCTIEKKLQNLKSPTKRNEVWTEKI